MILNLGAGKKLRADSINVDVTWYPGIDEQVDLEEFPWPWDDCSVDGIHASHIMEHFLDQKEFLLECYRILKPGGFLRIVGPHSSCVSSIGCLGHFRTYSVNTFHDYLARPFYMFKLPLFKTVEKRLNWWYEDVDAEGNLPKWMVPILKDLDKVINAFANKFPRFTENVICPAIQFREVVWKGIKL